MSKTTIAVKHFRSDDRVSLETAVIAYTCSKENSA